MTPLSGLINYTKKNCTEALHIYISFVIASFRGLLDFNFSVVGTWKGRRWEVRIELVGSQSAQWNRRWINADKTKCMWGVGIPYSHGVTGTNIKETREIWDLTSQLIFVTLEDPCHSITAVPCRVNSQTFILSINDW